MAIADTPPSRTITFNNHHGQSKKTIRVICTEIEIEKAGRAGKGAPSAAPLIDTSLAAATAARMIAARNSQPPVGASAEKPHESGAFKQLKEGLAKPAPALGGNLAPVAGQSKSNLPHGFSKQVSRGQTFGADVNRSGVPRRTGG